MSVIPILFSLYIYELIDAVYTMEVTHVSHPYLGEVFQTKKYIVV